MPPDSRARKFPQSIWLQPDGHVSYPFLWIAGLTLLTSIGVFTENHDLIKTLIVPFAPGMIIAWLVKWILWQSELIALCLNVVQMAARQQCHHSDEWECAACYARGVLKEHFPEKLKAADSGYYEVK